MYSIGEFAKIGVSIQTLRDWDKSGKLKLAYRSKGNDRYYSQEELNKILQKRATNKRINVGYVRVSANHQSVKQHFIQIPFIQFLKYIEEKAKDVNIKVIRVDEAYTSKISFISEDVFDVQEYSNGKSQEESSCTIKSKN